MQAKLLQSSSLVVKMLKMILLFEEAISNHVEKQKQSYVCHPSNACIGKLPESTDGCPDLPLYCNRAGMFWCVLKFGAIWEKPLFLSRSDMSRDSRSGGPNGERHHSMLENLCFLFNLFPQSCIQYALVCYKLCSQWQENMPRFKMHKRLSEISIHLPGRSQIRQNASTFWHLIVFCGRNRCLKCKQLTHL